MEIDQRVQVIEQRLAHLGCQQGMMIEVVSKLIGEVRAFERATLMLVKTHPRIDKLRPALRRVFAEQEAVAIATVPSETYLDGVQQAHSWIVAVLEGESTSETLPGQADVSDAGSDNQPDWARFAPDGVPLPAGNTLCTANGAASTATEIPARDAPG